MPDAKLVKNMKELELSQDIHRNPEFLLPCFHLSIPSSSHSALKLEALMLSVSIVEVLRLQGEAEALPRLRAECPMQKWLSQGMMTHVETF